MSFEVDSGAGDKGVDENGERLLEVVRRFALELRPQKRLIEVKLDSELGRDLGFDSLSRVELLLRVERSFAISLPEQVLTIAETPRDLLQAILSAGTAQRPAVSAVIKPVAAGEAVGTPLAAQTLLEVLDWHVHAQPQRPHAYIYGDSDEPEVLTYSGLQAGARKIAAGLAGRGLEPGQAVAIMLPSGHDYLFSFFGILLAGGVPVPIYPPAHPSQLEDHLRRHAGILANAQAVLLITIPQAQAVARLLQAHVEALQGVVIPEELATAANKIPANPKLNGQDVALLQYTSGSTGQPKGVVLTHANLLANIRAMGEAVEVESTDVFVSWLPLYHDMGLIGAWLGSLYYAMPLVLMSPTAFLARPQRWLWTIHRHRGTLSAAPNFAYELCSSELRDEELEDLDLSSWRVAFNGAEPVSPQTLRHFCERFAPYGFRRDAMAPAYGLAEAAVALAIPPLQREPLIDRIQREPFTRMGRAIPADKEELDALEFVACGLPLPGHQVRIAGPDGRELPDREEGRLEFRGPSCTRGYLRNAEASRQLFDGEWLDSGDLAYIASGDIYLTSRVKDVIIRGGRNIYPYEVEEAVGDVPGIRKGCVAMFGSKDPDLATERVVIVAETHATDPQALELMHTKINAVATELLGLPADDVELAPPRTVPKTASGKIRRNACRELYERGRIGKQPRAVWWQLARVAVAGLLPGWRRLRRALSDFGYATYVRIVFWILAPLAWLLVTLLPSSRWRWPVMRVAARLLFRLARVPLLIQGLEQLPCERVCVMVANHASYLDGIVLVAALPPEFSFIAKAELKRQIIPRVFLQRIGGMFVERFDQQKGVTEVRRTVQVARAGRSLLFFPEGKLTRAPGLLPFYMGAFVTAAEAAVPVVPITLRGTRSILRSGSWFPRRGAITLIAGGPIFPDGSDWEAAVKLRDSARSEILRHLQEPDLATEVPRV